MEEIVKILVVDDDEVDRMAVHRALKAAGIAMESSESNSCAAAIVTLQQQSFDCVFLDYRLPDGDGLNLVQQVRALGITVPLIVLTGQGDEQIAVALMKAGASDYLSKAKISPDNLSRSLRNAVRLYQAEQAAALADQKLKESEERYRLVLEGANDGIWDWYCATDEVYCNDRLLEIIGVSRLGFDLTPAAFTALMHPEDLPRIQAVVAAHLNRNEKCEVEFRIRHTSGKYRYCVARGKALRDRYGCPLRISGVLTDITERTQLEEALRASESRFRRLADANVIGIVVADRYGDIIETNDAFLEMLGYTRQELNSGELRWQNVTPLEYTARDIQAAYELMATGALTPFEKEYIRKDGSRVSALVGGALVEGQEKTAICFVIDLSQRKHAEAEIVKLNRDLERRISELQTLLDVIPIGIAIAEDPECRCIRLNPALTKLLELPPGVHTLNSSDLNSSDSEQDGLRRRDQKVATEQLLMHHVAAEGTAILDTELDLVIHEERPVVKLLGNAVPLFDEQGKSRGGIGAFLDITERKRVEEQERFLAEASALLTISLDCQTTLENLARLVVPRLADWCTVHVVEEDQSLSLAAVAHVNPAMVQGAKEVQRRYPVNPDGPFGTPKVVRTGKADFYPQMPDSLLEAAAHDAEHLQILRQAGFNSFMCVPLLARGRTLGAISFLLTEAGRSYTQADLALAEDLGRRAGLAVDNSRLYREATDIGENLRQAIIILGEQQQQLRALQRITNLLNQRLTNLPGLLQVMVRAVCDGIGGAEFALILLHNPTSNRLELTATAGSGAEKLPTESFHTEAGLLGQVFLTGKSQFQVRSEASETPHPERHTPNATPRTPHSALQPASLYAVAIESAQAGRLGVLVIGNWENPAAFDIEDRNLLIAVGEQAAIAINNARLLNALEEREERLGVQNEVLAQQNRELEHRQQQIEQQNLELIEAARLKSQFLATMSHELRTPMNAVIGFAQVLLRQRSAPLSQQQADMVERILNNGKNLLALIDDILDLSKIEAGRLELQLEEFSLTQLVLTTIAELRSLAEQRQLPLKVYTDLQNPKVINDRTRLRQVLVNLLSNAIKFTDTGSVEVRVSDLSASQIVVFVKDTGIGIAESNVERIFEEFRQVDQTLSKKYQGTGLGLAITKSLVGMMKGTITVESKLGQGSTFRVELPRRVGSEE